MKKMQCEVCGSTEIKKVSDGIFECQSCGVQYNTAEVKKLLVEVTGKVKIDHSEEVENNLKRAEQYEQAGNNTKAAEYYNAALDMDADNKFAQQRVKEIADQQELEDYYIIEPDVDPQENVRQFLEQLAATQNIACDIYKEIAIKSVTEKYMTFYFMKAKYQVDWTATACHIYYENQTVYKERYDSTLKRRVKEPVTEKVQRVNRVPQSGTHIFNSEELVLASDSLGKHFAVETDTAKRALLSAFETQQDSKYGTYNTQKINPRDVKKEGGKYIYKGLVLDAQIDKRIYSDRKKRMADTASERAAPEITNSIGGDYYENLNAIRHTLSESVAYVCIPVQIIEYTYKGKNYAALSDLLSYTTTMPLIYPCDTELATAMERLETQKKVSEKAPGLKAGLITIGIGFVFMLLGMIPGFEEMFIPIALGLMLLGFVVCLVAFIIQRSRTKKFKSSASDIKRTLFDPRVSALGSTKKQFFEEYTDYASAQNAAANADCLAIKQTNPELGDAGAIRKKMAFVTNDVDSDDTITALEDGIKQIQKKRTIGILSGLLIGALLGVLGIVCLSEMRYLHTIVSCILWVMTIGGFGFAFFGSIVIMGNMNKQINHLHAAIAAHKLRKQLNEEFENPQDRPESMSRQLSVWSEDRIAETVSQIAKQTDKSVSKKERLHNWLKAHKILLFIISGILLLSVLVITIEAIICGVQSKSYEQALVGKTYEHTEVGYREQSKYTATGTYYFGEDGQFEYTFTRIGMPGENYWTYTKSGSYNLHYDFVTGEYTLMLGIWDCEVHIDADSKMYSFIYMGDTYYEVSDSESNPSNGGNPSNSTPLPTAPTSNVPYSTKLSASVAIYTEPNGNSTYVQTIGQDGIYTIVEEAYDSDGNLWGKLMSGVGWVLLNENGASSARTCPQCGMTEPDVIFTEDWKPGDVCFGCNYDNFHGGEEAKKYCSQCGADCTYRGLEEDGRCEDCHFSDSNSPSGGNNVCAHNYTAATCTEPQICTLCGATNGSALEHTYSAANCTMPKTCTVCGTTSGGAVGHTWKNATCTEPQTCTQCGETKGSALGHNYHAATCTTPQTCSVCNATNGTALGHSWHNITETVYHEEQGHYEEVQDAKKVQKYRCWLCSYAQPTYATKDEYYAHFDSTHGNNPNSNFFRERYELVEEWVYETVIVWVIDKEAYTETIVTGRECDVCGKKE